MLSLALFGSHDSRCDISFVRKKKKKKGKEPHSVLGDIRKSVSQIQLIFLAQCLCSREILRMESKGDKQGDGKICFSRGVVRCGCGGGLWEGRYTRRGQHRAWDKLSASEGNSWLVLRSQSSFIILTLLPTPSPHRSYMCWALRG